MSFSTDTPLRGAGRGLARAFLTWATDHDCDRPADVREYLETVYRLAPQLNLNPDLVVVQSIHETTEGGAPWASHWWNERCNPAGIGITGDPEQNAASRDFGSGTAAARAHLLHLSLYVNGADVPAGFSTTEDPRWENALQAGFAGIATTLAGLTNRWAADADYADKIARRLNDLERNGLFEGSPGNPPPAPGPKPYVLLIAGHRSVGDGGDDVERQLTDDLARAYLDVFREAGYETDWFQQVDGNLLPNMTEGGLDGLALGVGRRIVNRPEDLTLMLDLHFDGRRSVVHVVVPHNLRQNGQGPLNSGYVQGRVPEDIAANNPLDVRLAGSIAREIASIPGMSIRGPGLSGLKGVMLENETGVGDPEPPFPNSRLAIMAATANSRMKAVRITIEHGGTDDAEKPDFFNKAARATLRAVSAELGNRIDTGTGAGSSDAHSHDGLEIVPPLAAFLFGAVDIYSFNPEGPVSQLWLQTGNETGRFPRLIDVLDDGQTKHFLFSDGSVIVARGESPVEFLAHVP